MREREGASLHSSDVQYVRTNQEEEEAKKGDGTITNKSSLLRLGSELSMQRTDSIMACDSLVRRVRCDRLVPIYPKNCTLLMYYMYLCSRVFKNIPCSRVAHRVDGTPDLSSTSNDSTDVDQPIIIRRRRRASPSLSLYVPSLSSLQRQAST